MFELGFTEIIVIAIVAILVMGPEQLPKAMYKVGKWARQLSYTRFALERQFEAFMDKEEQREQRRSVARTGDPDRTGEGATRTDPDGSSDRAA